MRLRSRVLAALASGCIAARGQTAPIVRVIPQALEPWPQVGLDVRVLDRDGEPMANVRADQLTVRDNGHAVGGAVLVSAEAEPQSVCLVLDRSGSTYPDRNAIDEETAALIRNLPENDELCLVTFSSEPHVDTHLTMNRREVAEALRYTHPNGGSALLDGLEMAAAEMQAHARYRSQAIVLVADGGENASAAKYPEIVRDFAETGAPVIYGVITDDPSERSAAGRETQLMQEQTKNMLRLINGTGGRAYKPEAADRVAAVKDLLHSMSARYRLVYSPPSHDANGREHTVDVQLSKDLKKQKISLAVTRSYYAPMQ